MPRIGFVRRRVIQTCAQQRGYFLACPGCREFERLVDMNVALGNTPGGVAEERGDRQLGKAKFAGHAPKGVAQCVGRQALKLARVLDENHTVGCLGGFREQCIDERGLAGRCATRDKHQLPRHNPRAFRVLT